MSGFQCESGDIIFYEGPSTFPEHLIVDGEKIADHESRGTRYFYHCAVALNPHEMLEAVAHTQIDPITLHHAVVVRPPYPDRQKLWDALAWSRRRVGHLYGWFGIFDQVLRKLSGNRIYVPRRIIQWVDNIWPYCSVLVGGVEYRAGVDFIQLWPPPDPVQLFEPQKQYVIYDWREKVKRGD